MIRQEACTLGWGTPMNGERTVTTDDDSLLVARFVRGDSGAFDTLFLKYQEYVYHIIYGIVGSGEESRDLTQEVFLQVYRSLPKFRQNSRFATWLYRIAVNRAVDAARGAKRWRFLPLLDEPGMSERPADPDLEPEKAAATAHSSSSEGTSVTLERSPSAIRRASSAIAPLPKDMCRA